MTASFMREKQVRDYLIEMERKWAGLWTGSLADRLVCLCTEVVYSYGLF